MHWQTIPYIYDPLHRRNLQGVRVPPTFWSGPK